MISILKESVLFKNVDEDKIEEVINSVRYTLKDYKKDDIIHYQGEVCTSLSILIKGKANIQIINPNGRILIMSSFKESDIFAEVLLFSNENEYPAEIVAITDVKLLELSKESVLSIMAISNIFTENILSLLSDKVVLLKRKINLLEGGTIRQKICRLLIDRYQREKTMNIKISSKKELADELGIPRPSLSRELILMRDEGIIDFTLKEITLIDLELIKDEIIK
ncbi:MAG: Crp/Fnr family transcriptional regulator [Clostridium sp.]